MPTKRICPCRAGQDDPICEPELFYAYRVDPEPIRAAAPPESPGEVRTRVLADLQRQEARLTIVRLEGTKLTR